MTDIVIAAVPYVDTWEPIMAPALLKSIALQQGYSCVAMDLNIKFLDQIKDLSNKDQIIEFFTSFTPNPAVANDVSMLISNAANTILEHNPKIVALSLLTHHSQIFTRWLAVKIKSLRPDVKIIIGGSGIKDLKDGLVVDKNVFCDELISLGLIDHFIIGDGEIAFRKYLNGDYSYPGINTNTWVQPLELDQFPYPDYSDYNLHDYIYPCIPVTDSRGCVRDCEFCDVIEHWKKYVYRSADSLFAEMLYQIENHGIYHFSMRNSLTNGNMKEFKKWLDLVVDYNEGKPREKQISWFGFFIVREPDQHPEEMWEKLGKSNGFLQLGVESVIKHVRWNMRKKFSNEAIDYHLEMGRKYNVPLRLLMIVASPDETLEDYAYTKQWFLDRYKYANNSVVSVSLTIASILPGTAWDRKKDERNVLTGDYPSIWINQNLRITAKQRMDYFAELSEICKFFEQPNTIDGQTIIKPLSTPKPSASIEKALPVMKIMTEYAKQIAD